MTPSPEFLDSLRPDDLVAATVQSSGKLHLIRIVKRVMKGMTKGSPTSEQLAQLFDGRVLCKANPRYWWRPQEDLERWAVEDRCPWCWQRWRVLGRPAITGWKKPEATVTSTLTLPWGWAEVTVAGHPLDLPADAPDPDPEEKEEEVGAKRIEVRRWVRGERYVRITQALADKRFCSRYGDLNDKPQAEGWNVRGGWKIVLQSAITMMALGGSPAGKTKHEKLTLKEANDGSSAGVP